MDTLLVINKSGDSPDAEKWEDQCKALTEIAEINGIPFNPLQFRVPEERFLLHRKRRFLQSDAALYIGEQIGLLKQQGRTIFYPWGTSPGFSKLYGERYSLTPWMFIPTVATPKYVGDKELINAVMVDASGSPEIYLNGDVGRRGLELICKNCLHKWKHYCGVSASGHAHENPDDIIEIEREDGTVVKSFRCPECGCVEIFKVGAYILWD